MAQQAAHDREVTNLTIDNLKSKFDDRIHEAHIRMGQEPDDETVIYNLKQDCRDMCKDFEILRKKLHESVPNVGLQKSSAPLTSHKTRDEFWANLRDPDGDATSVKWSQVFEEFWASKLIYFGLQGERLHLQPFASALDDFLIEVGQRAFLEEGKDWNVQDLLVDVELEIVTNPVRMWGPDQLLWGHPVKSSYFSACLREIAFMRCYVFLREYCDILTRDDIRKGLEGGKLPLEMIDSVAEQACEGRKIPAGLPGESLMLPSGCEGLSLEQKQLKGAEVAIQSWKCLQEWEGVALV